VDGYSSLNKRKYVDTLYENLVSARFQSNHHLGYFCLKRIISTSGKNRRPPTYGAACQLLALSSQRNVPPPSIRPITIKIGIAVNMRKKLVSLFSGLSG
jgi:hypothetical protein